MMRQSSLLMIFLVVFIDLAGFGIIIPILPYYAQAYGASAWKLGWLLASYSVLQLALAPLWGRLSDWLGRRPVLLLTLLGTSASLAILGLAGSMRWLFIGRILAGIFGANLTTAYAYVADVTAPEERAKGFGMVGAAFGLGFIFGPAIGGVLSRYGYAFPMFVAAALALVNFVFAYFKLEEPRTNPELRKANRIYRFTAEGLKLALGDQRARLAIALSFLLTLAMTQMETVFAIYLGRVYGFDAEICGVLLAVMGLIIVAVQAGLLGKLVRDYGELKLIAAGLGICSLSLIGFVSMTILVPAVMLICLYALGYSLSFPTLTSIATQGAHTQRRGNLIGVHQFAGGIARVVGPLIAGWLYDRISWRSPFMVSSLVLAIGFVVAGIWLGVSRREPVPQRNY